MIEKIGGKGMADINIKIIKAIQETGKPPKDIPMQQIQLYP